MKYLAQREGVSGLFSFSPSLRGQHRRRFLRGVRGAPRDGGSDPLRTLVWGPAGWRQAARPSQPRSLR